MTTMLSTAAFDTSRQFIEAKARPLEIARFHSHFDGASHEPVIAALEEFRNADGGFGRALEPDVRVSESSLHIGRVLGPPLNRSVAR